MEEKEPYSPVQIAQDNVLMGVTFYSVSSVLKIVQPGLYAACWTPWLWGLILLWGGCEIVIITKAILGWKNQRNAIKPLAAEELLYQIRTLPGSRKYHFDKASPDSRYII
ncbi:MAG: hypothetical protein ACM3QW_06345, partial [Ignavibacteriales bacterium]